MWVWPLRILVLKPKTMKTSSLIPCLLALAGLLAAPLASSAANLVVTNLADSGPGTLRSALTNAASGAVITFDPRLSGATITLNNTLTINTNITIDASALPGGLQINGNGSVQMFNVASNIFVLLNSLTITNGYSPISYRTNDGGGIKNNGTLTLTNYTLSGNSAYDRGVWFQRDRPVRLQRSHSGQHGPANLDSAANQFARRRAALFL